VQNVNANIFLCLQVNKAEMSTIISTDTGASRDCITGVAEHPRVRLCRAAGIYFISLTYLS